MALSAVHIRTIDSRQYVILMHRADIIDHMFVQEIANICIGYVNYIYICSYIAVTILAEF